MNQYSIDGATSTARDRAQLEPQDRGVDDWPLWHWDPRGSIDGKMSQSLVQEPSIKGFIHGCMARGHGITQWFVWDLGIGFQLHRTMRLVDRYRLLEGKQSWGGRIFVIFLFLVSLMAWLGWTSMVGGSQVKGVGLLHPRAQELLEGLYGVLRSFFGI